MKIWLSLCAVVFLSTAGRLYSILNPEEFPNLLAGSFTDGGKFSTGNTLPLVGMPWGFNHWAPQTRDRSRYTGSWWFFGSDHQFTWLRCTHQPSPWIGDWGYFHFTPMIGEISHSPVYYWEPRGAYIKPYLFDATVAPFNVRIQLTPTNHAAMLRVTFPAERDIGEKHVCFASARWSDHNSLSSGGYYFTGSSTQVNSDRMLVNNFALRIRAESPEATAVGSMQDMMCFKYARDAHVVTVKIATSLISPEQATLNMERELASKPFDQVLQESREVWNSLLRRVDVVDAGPESGQSSRDLIVFYTGLYRGLTFPRRLDEQDRNGNIVHYSPYDRSGRVFPGPLVTDNGLWDTFRTVYPLLSLAYPDHLGNIVQGWINAYREGEWLPSWASPGYRNCMVGTFADVVLADAIVKDIGCFDVSHAVAAMLKDAYQEGPPHAGGAVAKEGLREYIRLGYLPIEAGGEVVSRTLDYGFADYSTAQALLHLDETSAVSNKDELRGKAAELHQRAVRAFTSLFDSGRGLMVPKTRHGGFSPHFSAVQWGNGYTEGSPWHHSFPPYAISCAVEAELHHAHLREENPLDCKGGLPGLFGGKANLLKKLHELIASPSRFEVGSYQQEIHEMTEMRAFSMGQYGHNNQPVHHILYLFALLGEAQTTQRTVREVMQRGYGPDFYAGDEDNGEMGAWFVLSALGLYSVTPGSPYYVLGSPIFPHVRIHHTPRTAAGFAGCVQPELQARARGGAAGHLDIFALGTSRDRVLVDRVRFNQSDVVGSLVHHAWLQGDGVLEFVMQGDPAGTGRRGEELQAVHRTDTPELERRLYGQAGQLRAGAVGEKAGEKAGESDSRTEAAWQALQNKLHDQQESIDHLMAELSKEKALAYHPDGLVDPSKTDRSSLLLLLDSVCYLGLLCVAILTIVLTLHAVMSLFVADGSMDRWRRWNCAVLPFRTWWLWCRVRFFDSSSVLVGSEGASLSGKPTAYTV